MSDHSTFIGLITACSKKAIKFQDHFWHGERWLPRSQMVLEWLDGEWRIHLKDWLCKKNQLRENEENTDEGD